MTQKISSNYTGTTFESFRIGKNGTTILQGDLYPPDTLGEDGDIYIRQGVSTALFLKTNQTWKTSDQVNDDEQIFIDLFDVLNVSSNNTVVFVNDTSLLYDQTTTTYDETDITFDSDTTGPTVINLPTLAVEGQVVTVKDLGGASSTRPINVNPPTGVFIDDSSSYSLATRFASISFIFAGGNWRKI